MPDGLSLNTPRIVTSKYRQALIARFWSTMRSIVQADLLIKHLETYSPNTGHLSDYNISDQSRQQNENHDQQHSLKFENQQSPQIQPIDDSNNLSPNSLSVSVSKMSTSITTVNTGITEAKSANILIPGVPSRSPLRSGIPLFYNPSTNSNILFPLKQSQVRLK